MPTGYDEPPLIVTAALDASGFALLDAMRRRYFPPSLNKIPAHVSLFHRLPGEAVEAVITTISNMCERRTRFALRAAPLRFLGRGVAIGYESPELGHLHSELAEVWRDWLTAQDRQCFRPHVTIQNKVEPATARALFESLAGDAPPTCHVEGVSVWRYRGGPWEPIVTCRFADQNGAMTV